MRLGQGKGAAGRPVRARRPYALYMTRRLGACILGRHRDGDLALVDGPAMPAAVEPGRTPLRLPVDYLAV